jgi:hypothetical protein
MKELSKQIKNAEARFQILELQMQQNGEDHKELLERIEHNCNLQQKRFDTIEGKIDKFMEIVADRYAKIDEVKSISERQWKALIWVATFCLTTIVGLFIYLLKL